MRFGVAMRGALTTVLAAGLLIVPAGAGADGVGSVPDAPTKFDETGGSSSEVTFGWKASVEQGSPVTGYQLERSVDGGATWQDDPRGATTETNATVDTAPSGHAWLHRVVAVSDAGRSKPSIVVTEATPEMGTTGTQRFVIKTADGAPLTAGQLSWWNGYDDTKWSKPVRLSADGVVDLTNVPAGYSYVLRLEDAYLQSGVRVYRSWSVNMGTEPQTLIVPSPPAMQARIVRVVLPNGVPVAGAEVNIDHYSGLLDQVSQEDFHYFSDPSAVLWGRTDSTGTLVLRGWPRPYTLLPPPSEYPYPQQAVLVDYDDGTLHEQKTVLLDGVDTSVELNPVPWVTNSTPDPTVRSTTTALSFVAHGAPAATTTRTGAMSTHKVSGFKVTVTPPAGWTSKGCTKKPVLSGTTDAAGRVRLSVCGSRSGYFKVNSPGAVNTGSVLLRVKGAPPLAPAKIAAASRAAGQVTVGWTKPAYNGGSTITSYKVTASSPGQKTRTVVLKAASLSALHYTFSGLARAEAWTTTVSATTAKGTGSARTASVRTV